MIMPPSCLVLSFFEMNSMAKPAAIISKANFVTLKAMI